MHVDVQQPEAEGKAKCSAGTEGNLQSWFDGQGGEILPQIVGA
jgi:hypothetical protein